MDVLLGESENSQDSALSTFIANSMYVPYSSMSSSCAASSTFPLNCGDCVPSSKQLSLLNDASSTSSVLPFVFQNCFTPLYFGVGLTSQKQPDFSAEHDILQSQNRRNLDAQNDVKSTALIIAAETTTSVAYNLDSLPEQYSLGKEVSPPPGFESLTSTVALPSTSVVSLLNSVAAAPVSVASPRSSVVPSLSPVVPLLPTEPISPNTGTWMMTANQERGTGSLLWMTVNQDTRTRLLPLTTANQETGTGSSLSIAANEEKGTGLSLFTTANQETETRSTKTNRKPAKSELYKTELCRAFSEKGSCGYGEKCQFAHGECDQRTILRHMKYKTKQCWTYHSTGFCYYGARCNFIHDENRLDRSKRLGDNSARLDPTSGISSDPSLGMNFNPTSVINSVPSLSMNLDPTLAVDWDPRLKVNAGPNLEVNSDLAGLGLNPRVEQALNAGVGLKLDSRIVQSLKPGISLNSQPTAGRNAKPNTLPLSYGMVPISSGIVRSSPPVTTLNMDARVALSSGQISKGMVPITYGLVPISNGMVRSSPPITTLNMDARVALSSGQTPKQRNQFNNTLRWNFENQSFGHSSAFRDANSPELSVSAARDKDITFQHSSSEFSGVALEDRLAHGLSHLSNLSPPPIQSQIFSTSMLRRDGHSWNKQNGVLGVSLSQSCMGSSSLSHTSMVPATNIWSSLIKHPRGWTLS